jgi:hypothetical protein
MPNDIVISEPRSTDTLSILDNIPGGSDDRTTPLMENQSEPDEKEEKIEITEGQEEEPVIKDELDFAPAINKKALLKEFPELFKKFPQLERAIYKERQLSEIFPTVADAKATQERAQVLTRAEEQLSQGYTEEILRSVKSEDEEAFKRIVDNFLPTIDKLDRGSYLHIIANLGRHIIKNIAAEANRFGNDTEQGKFLRAVGIGLNQHLFGNSEWREPSLLAKPITEADKRVNEREQALVQQRFIEVQEDLSTRSNNAIKSTIAQYIDPKETMSPFVRDTAIDRCMSKVDEVINADLVFKAKLDKLWEQVVATNFSKPAQEKVKSAYLAKAQVHLGEIIKSVRAIALAGTKNAPRTKAEVEDNPRTDSGSSTTNKRGREIKQYPRGMSTVDILNRELGD